METGRKQPSLRWRTVCLVAGVGTICLHREVAGGDPHRRTALPYWAETAGWRAGGVGGGADGPNHQRLWEGLRQRGGAPRVPARGGPDGPVRSVGGVGKHGAAGRGDAHLWLAESVARGFLQTLQSLLRGHRRRLRFSCDDDQASSGNRCSYRDPIKIMVSFFFFQAFGKTQKEMASIIIKRWFKPKKTT